MKVFKNLFGDNSKIHASEIITGNKSDSELLSDKLKGLNIISKRGNGSIDIQLSDNSFYILLVSTGSNSNVSNGIYIIHTYGSGFSNLYVINDSGHVDVSLNVRSLQLNRSNPYNYCLIDIKVEI